MIRPIATTLAAMLVFSGCGSNQTQEPAVNTRLDALRDLTRPYQDFNAAQSAGYSLKITECMTDATGAMGLHYGKAALLDGVVEESKPEVLLYEPSANGGRQLVGIEYVVPFDAWTATTPPELFGEKFQRNEAFKVWALHSWIWRENPKGVFVGWNPGVTCAHATVLEPAH